MFYWLQKKFWQNFIKGPEEKKLHSIKGKKDATLQVGHLTLEGAVLNLFSVASTLSAFKIQEMVM